MFLRLFPERLKPRIRPWLWLAPALLFLFVFLVYPTIGTIIRSFQNKAGTAFIGLDNYAWFFTNDATLTSPQEQRAVGRPDAAVLRRRSAC